MTTWSRSILLGGTTAVPGIVAAVLAFGAYDAVMRFLPWSDLLVLSVFAVAFAVFLLFVIHADPGLGRENELIASVVIGLVLGGYGMGAWELASMGLLLFPAACLLAYEGVVRATRTASSADVRPVVVVATLASLCLFLPALLIVQGLYSTALHLPELLRETVLAAFLSLLYACTMLSLSAGYMARRRSQRDVSMAHLHTDS